MQGGFSVCWWGTGFFGYKTDRSSYSDHHTILCSSLVDMKVLVVLFSLATVALASLEPAGYRPPGLAPSGQYLPPSRYSGAVAPSNQYLPARRSSSSAVAVPSNQYLPAARYQSALIHQQPSNQYLPAERSSSASSKIEAPSRQYLPASRYNSVETASTRYHPSSFSAPSNEYLPADRYSAAQKQEAPAAQYLPASIQYSSVDTAAPSQQYLPASRYTGAAVQPSNQYLPANGISADTSGQYSGSAYNNAPSSQYLPAVGEYSSHEVQSGYEYGAAEESIPAKYEFEYMVKDEPSGNDYGHHEARDGDHTHGVYSVVLPDGRKQIVQYEADKEGYKPKISYEEPAQGYKSGGYNYNREAASAYAQGHPEGPY